MKMKQFKPFVISPCYSHSSHYYQLENGVISFEAELPENMHFEYDSPCLAMIDYEVVKQGVVITEVHLIATNVDRINMLSWLNGMQENLIGYLIILIGIITKVSDNKLRSDLVSIIFHNQLHPKRIFTPNNEQLMDLYPSLIITGQKALLKCQQYSCTQKLRDTLLVSCLLKKMVKNDIIGSNSEYDIVKAKIEYKLSLLII